MYALIFGGFLIIGCGTQNKAVTAVDGMEKEEPVRIANDSLEYEVIIIDIGFTNYLNTVAFPMDFYSESFLETRNRFYVIEWNNRARNATQFDPNVYENVINYQPNINYGLEVNYKLFWYFQFAQRKYNMRLSNFRIYGAGGSVVPFR